MIGMQNRWDTRNEKNTPPPPTQNAAPRNPNGLWWGTTLGRTCSTDPLNVCAQRLDCGNNRLANLERIWAKKLPNVEQRHGNKWFTIGAAEFPITLRRQTELICKQDNKQTCV